MSLASRGVRNPQKAFRRIYDLGIDALRQIYGLGIDVFGKKKGVLIYIGLHRGRTFQRMFRRYRACYGFEANPDIFGGLEEKYRRYPHVHLFNVAVADFDGEVTFNISSNDGESSSMGNFDERWEKYRSGLVRMTKSIKVPSINILLFCKAHGIDYIDDYFSDIQGMDLQVLKTMRQFIEEKKIGTITCETTKDSVRNIYVDLPENTESGFRELLKGKYELTAKGWGLSRDGVNLYKHIPEEAWEMDCKWRRVCTSSNSNRSRTKPPKSSC